MNEKQFKFANGVVWTALVITQGLVVWFAYVGSSFTAYLTNNDYGMYDENDFIILSIWITVAIIVNLYLVFIPLKLSRNALLYLHIGVCLFNTLVIYVLQKFILQPVVLNQ